MLNSNSRGASLVPAAITFGVIAAMVILVGQITLRPWASANDGYDTHLNYSTVSDDYTRSIVGRVGDSEDAPDGWTPAEPIGPGNTFAAWVGYGCASCHGLDGAGGLVGPNLQELVRDDFVDKIRFGADGMPAFGEMDLTDEHLAVLSDYLIEVGGPPPTATPVPPTPAPTSTPIPTPTVMAAPTITPVAGATPTEIAMPDPTEVSGGDDELLAIGKLLYEETAGINGCAECHGFEAEGGGPASGNAPSIRGTTRNKIRSSLQDAFDMEGIKLSSDDLTALEAYLSLFKTE